MGAKKQDIEKRRAAWEEYREIQVTKGSSLHHLSRPKRSSDCQGLLGRLQQGEGRHRSQEQAALAGGGESSLGSGFPAVDRLMLAPWSH